MKFTNYLTRNTEKNMLTKATLDKRKIDYIFVLLQNCYHPKLKTLSSLVRDGNQTKYGSPKQNKIIT